MSKLFKLIGFFIKWIGSLTVLYINHIVLVEEGSELDMFGFLVSIIIVLSFIRWVDGRVKVWDIQNRHITFRLVWNHGKQILLVGCITWMLFSVENNLGKLKTTGLLITSCFFIGFIFTLLGNLKIKKAT